MQVTNKLASANQHKEEVFPKSIIILRLINIYTERKLRLLLNTVHDVRNSDLEIFLHASTFWQLVVDSNSIPAARLPRTKQHGMTDVKLGYHRIVCEEPNPN